MISNALSHWPLLQVASSAEMKYQDKISLFDRLVLALNGTFSLLLTGRACFFRGKIRLLIPSRYDLQHLEIYVADCFVMIVCDAIMDFHPLPPP